MSLHYLVELEMLTVHVHYCSEHVNSRIYLTSTATSKFARFEWLQHVGNTAR